MQRNQWLWIGVLNAAVLAACGGGGGSPGGAAPPPPPAVNFSVNAAWRNVLTSTRRWTVSGTASDGLDYVLTIQMQANASGLFDPLAASYPHSDAAVQLAQGGTIVNSGLNQSYYDANTFGLVGTANSANVIGGMITSCSVATSASVPPTTAIVGGTGPLATLNQYDGCLPPAQSTQVGTSTLSWSLETDSVTALSYFCMNSTVLGSTGMLFATESDCLEVATDGSLGTHARISVTQGGFSLTARN